MRTFPAATAAVLCSALTLAACGSSDGGGEGGTQKVRIGISGGVSDAPFYLADELGYFEDENIEVELMPFKSGSDMIPPLGTGGLEVGATAATAALYNAASRDVSLRIVADKGHVDPDGSYIGIMVRKALYDSGEVKSVADLKDRKVIDFAESSSTSAFLERTLATGDLTIKDVNRVFLPAGEQVAALKNGSADAGISVEPYVTSMVEDGVAVRLPKSDEFYPEQQTSVLLYGEQFASDQEDAAQRFMNAYLKGVEYFQGAVEDGTLTGENADEVINIVSKETKIKPEVLAKTPVNGVNVDGSLNMDSLEEDFDFYKKYDYLDDPDMKWEELVDTSFTDNAAKDD